MEERSASLSFRQAIGILLAMPAVALVFSTPFALFTAIMVSMKKDGRNDFIPMLIGSVIGCVIVIAMAVVLSIVSLRLLKDPKGMRIPWLEKRFKKIAP